MLHYADTDVVFQEIPDEITLAVSISGCPCRCPGCHSPHLWKETGKPLDADAIDALLAEQPSGITCVALMGGDADPQAVDHLASAVRQRHPKLHTAWWSGRTVLSAGVRLKNFDYIKLGPYLSHLGPLKSRRTNQRLYKIEQGRLCDITARFWR